MNCGSAPVFAVMLAAGFVPLTLVAAPQATEPSFEVASVKPSAPIGPGDRVYFGPPRGGPGTRDPRRITWTYAALRSIVMAAYDPQKYQIIAPGWLSTERYDVAATVPEGATAEQVPSMWQKLLKERFGMVVHHESREFQVEELTVGRGGPKLKPTDLGPNPDPFQPEPGPRQFTKDGLPAMNGYGAIVTIHPDGKAQMVVKGLTMSDFATRLAGNLRMPVIDKTGLTGRYDFTVEFTLDSSQLPPPPAAAAAPGDRYSEPGPDLTAAVESQLGLKLSRVKAPLDVIVVDHAEKVPTEN